MNTAPDAAAAELATMMNAWRDLAVEWELTWQERRDLLPAGGDETAAPAADTEKRMRILLEIGYRLRFGNGAELREWLRDPSEFWRWHTPLEVMSGGLELLRRFRRHVEQEGVR